MSVVKKSGCMKQVGIGCLVLLVILIIGGIIVGIKFHSAVKDAGGMEAWKNKKSSEFMNYVVQQSLAELPLNIHEKATITKIADRLSERMSKGEIDTAKSAEVVVAGYNSMLPETFIALHFQSRFLKPEDVESSLAVNRFANGLLQNKIDNAAAEPFLKIVLQNAELVKELHAVKPGETKKDPSRDIKFKKELPSAEILKAVAAMKAIADKAEVAPTRSDLNFAPILNKIINTVIPETTVPTEAPKAEVNTVVPAITPKADNAVK